MALQLGQGVKFVKSLLLQLPQDDDVWEVGFLPKADSWHGFVVERKYGVVLAQNTLTDAPTVSNLADLLADAMLRPLAEVHCHRPRSVRLRDNPVWQEFVPHLEELSIEVVKKGKK